MAYKKPTLFELFVELHLATDTLSEGDFFDIVPRLRIAGFADVELRDVVLSSLPGAADSTLVPRPRIRCWNDTRTSLVQLSQDFVAINVTRDYQGWGHFREIFDSAGNAVGDSILRGVESLNLSTIDRFTVPRDQFDVSKYLNCDGSYIATWYRGATESFDISLGKGFLKHDRCNRQLKIKVRTHEDPVSVELRAWFHDLVDHGPIADTLEKLHDESNEVFEGLITDATRHEIMGGRKE